MADLEYPWSYRTSQHIFSTHPGSLMLVKMRPQDFLDLAAPALEWSEDFHLSTNYQKDMILKGEALELPYFVVEDQRPIGKDCVVVGHEGRHRMSAAKDLGIETVPVVIKTSKRVKESAWFDSQAWQHPNVDEQTCIKCGYEGDGSHVCYGRVRAERGSYEGRGGIITESEGPMRDLAFERMDVDWCKVPDVKNATENWRKREGIELNCG